MLDKILYVVDEIYVFVYLFKSVLSPLLWTDAVIDSFPYLDNSSLFHMDLKILWVSERIGLPTALNNSTSILSIPCDLCLEGSRLRH